jgi:hypothetical protein
MSSLPTAYVVGFILVPLRGLASACWLQLHPVNERVAAVEGTPDTTVRGVLMLV